MTFSDTGLKSGMFFVNTSPLPLFLETSTMEYFNPLGPAKASQVKT
jgi:hypothetical protein